MQVALACHGFTFYKKKTQQVYGSKNMKSKSDLKFTVADFNME